MAIHYEKDGHIVTITIDRPEARNSLDLEHFGQLKDCWVRFRDDDEAFVAILTGVKDVYCVGADLKSFVSVVTEKADQLAAGGSKETVEGSKYSFADSLVAVLRDGATLPDGSEFALVPGQSVLLADHSRLTYTRLVNDSRCAPGRPSSTVQAQTRLPAKLRSYRIPAGSGRTP